MNKKLSVTKDTIVSLVRLPRRQRVMLSGWGFLTALCLVGLMGCGNIIPRGQSPDESIISMENDAKKTVYIADVCKVWGLDPKFCKHAFHTTRYIMQVVRNIATQNILQILSQARLYVHAIALDLA